MNNINRLFTEAVGMCWHECVMSEGIGECSCGEIVQGHYEATCHHNTNPTWDNPVEIVAAIKAIPCDKCKDGCIAFDRNDDICHTCQLTNGDPKCNCYKPCSCQNGVIDMWIPFMIHLWSHCIMLGANNQTTTEYQFWNFLINPESLMQKFIEFKETI